MEDIILPDAQSFGHDLANKLEQARCLILNADYQPVNYLPLATLNWKRAIIGSILDRVDVIEWYDDIIIRSPQHTFKMPSIVINKDFIKPRFRMEFSKGNVFLRDDYCCQYCGELGSFDGLTFDHWIPQSEGGGTTWENIVTACPDCNNRKGTQNRKRWKPRNHPIQPSYLQLVGKSIKRPIIIPDKRWAQYIGWQGQITIQNWKESYILE